MDRTFEVAYTPQVIKEGNRILIMRKWWAYALFVSVVAAILLSEFLATKRGISDAVLIFLPFPLIMAFPFIAYYMAARTTTAGVRKFLSPVGTVQVTDEALILRADTGSSEMVWRTIEQVITNPRVWIVMASQRSGFLIPIAEADDETKAFIRQMVTQHGGKVR